MSTQKNTRSKPRPRKPQPYMPAFESCGMGCVSGWREEEESDVTRALGCGVAARATADGWVALGLRP